MIPTRLTLCLWRAASRATLVWLLSAASAQAAVPARCAGRSALAVASVKLSDAAARPLKKVRPLRKAKCRARVSANVLVPRLGHAVARRPLAGAIVQGDEAPAAHDDARDSLVPSFSSLGFISPGGDASPSSRSFSPQSPRGPPLSA
jgi:hypothetical protein